MPFNKACRVTFPSALMPELADAGRIKSNDIRSYPSGAPSKKPRKLKKFTSINIRFYFSSKMRIASRQLAAAKALSKRVKPFTHYQ